MAYNISMGWKASEVNLGMYGDGGRAGYTERPVGILSVVKALEVGSDIECIVRRWCLQFVGLRADVLFQCQLTTTLADKTFTHVAKRPVWGWASKHDKPAGCGSHARAAWSEPRVSHRRTSPERLQIIILRCSSPG